MRLCERLAPGEDADALARDTLEAALTGLRAGFPSYLSSRPRAAIEAFVMSVSALFSTSTLARRSIVALSAVAAGLQLRDNTDGHRGGQAGAARRSRRRRSRAGRSIATCASPDRSLADEQAEVSAETGRPRRRRRRSSAAPASPRAPSWCASRAAETSAQLQEAEANAAQIEARLGLAARRSPSIRSACRT